jgi:chromate reductase, NAD(P)H dehydrogenase (quinone)
VATWLAVSGSLRAASTNSALVCALTANAPAGCRIDVYDGMGDLPIFNPDDEGDRTPLAAARWIDAVAACDGLIVSCPEYAHGIPGGLKNALDWLVSRDVAVGKPAILVHASTRSLYCRNALSEVMRTMSFALYEGPELEVQLLGKKPDEVGLILADAGGGMCEHLKAFATFIAGQSQ